MKSLSFRKDLIGVQEELLRFAYKLTANREEANDLLQETSLKALDNEEKYVPDTNFKGWMYTIMRNIFINNYRKIVRDQTFVDQTDNLYHLNLPSRGLPGVQTSAMAEAARRGKSSSFIPSSDKCWGMPTLTDRVLTASTAAFAASSRLIPSL